MHNLGNFYGKTFELDMASRCLISNWPINYVEDTQQKDIKQIDYIFFKNKRVVGVECLSKRFSMSARENMSFDSMIPDINNHADKFKPEYISKLQLPLDQRVLVIDITNSYYCVPKQLLTDFKKMHMPSNLDAVFLTWREDTVTGENHSLKVRYCGLGTQEYFTTTYAAEYHATTFSVRKYTEHEPTWGKWGPEESANESK